MLSSVCLWPLFNVHKTKYIKKIPKLPKQKNSKSFSGNLHELWAKRSWPLSFHVFRKITPWIRKLIRLQAIELFIARRCVKLLRCVTHIRLQFLQRIGLRHRLELRLDLSGTFTCASNFFLFHVLNWFEVKHVRIYYDCIWRCSHTRWYRTG